MGVIQNIWISNVKMSALHYIGKNDTREQSFMINTHQEQALLNTLLAGRDPNLYRKLYGLRNARRLAAGDARRIRQEHGDAL